MEPVGLAVGIFGLAGLYNTCIQVVEQVDTAKSLGADSQSILSKFETDKLLLKRWGENVGIVNGHVDRRHPSLEIDEERRVIYTILASIENIFADSEKLSKKYGLGLATVVPGTVQGARLKRQKVEATIQQQTTVFRKAIWAVKDKKKFQLLSADLSGFIERLYSVIQLDDGSDLLLAESVRQLKLSVDGMPGYFRSSHSSR